MAQIRVRDIRSFKPGLAIEVAQRLELQRCRVMNATQLALRARSATRSWRGPAAEAATDQQLRALVALTDLAARIATSAAVVRGLADRMEASSSLLRRAERIAWDGGAWADEDGAVHLPPRTSTGDATVDAHLQRRDDLMRAEVARCLDQAVHLATQTDAEVHRQLLRAIADSVAPTVTGGLDLVPPPPDGASGSPEGAFASAAWWRGLTDAERRSAIWGRPEWVGPRDGIPAEDRHRANLILLGRARLEALQALRQAGPHARRTAPIIWERAQSIMAIDSVLGRSAHGGDGVTRQLLLVDLSQPVVRAAVTVGDIDTAGHVVTFVGGLTTSPHRDLRRYDTRFTQMRAAAKQMAQRSGDQRDVAVVIWMGYPAPQLRDGAVSHRSVLRDDLAVEYAEDLASFTNGVAASRNVAPHQSLWAHSYGSVVAGRALEHLMTMDDVALFGSPGTSLDSLAEAGLKPGSLNVLAAPTDPVAHSGWHLRDPRHVPGITELAATCALKPGSTNDALTGSVLHSEYLLAGSTSEHNLLAIATGRAEERVRPPTWCPPSG